MIRIPEERELYACLQCGYCRAVCPIYAETGWESNNPRGKLFALKQLANRGPMDVVLRRDPKPGDDYKVRLYQCTSCGACDEVCHVNIKLAHLWEELKEWMLSMGYEPLEAHRKIRERVEKVRNPYDEPIDKRDAWLTDKSVLSPDPEVLFFAGCTASYRVGFLGQAVVKILKAADVKFNILGSDEWCCGSPLLRTGQTDVVRNELAPHNSREIETRGVNAIITACAGCYNTIKNDYPKIVGKPTYNLYHLTEYLEKLIKEKRLVFTKEFKKKVTYHDPCHLGRHARVFEAPRNVIKAIPGIELVEMDYNKEMAHCCGAGGGYKSAFNYSAESIAAKRVKEAEEVGAELIITSCPFCQVNLNAGAKNIGSKVKTIDIVQVLEQVI
ncbi:MAG: (Fe-S)-binding protein [Thermoplasmata archaeon]|nr:(Fe-S)-binding protein [Thermoplasmata archaeon]